MTDHVHSWETIGRDDQFGREVCRCVACGALDFADNIAAQQGGEKPKPEPYATIALSEMDDIALRPDDPTTSVLRETWSLLNDLDAIITGSPEARAALETRMIGAHARINSAKMACLKEWNRRLHANRRVIKGASDR